MEVLLSFRPPVVLIPASLEILGALTIILLALWYELAAALLEMLCLHYLRLVSPRAKQTVPYVFNQILPRLRTPFSLKNCLDSWELLW